MYSLIIHFFSFFHVKPVLCFMGCPFLRKKDLSLSLSLSLFPACFQSMPLFACVRACVRVCLPLCNIVGWFVCVRQFVNCVLFSIQSLFRKLRKGGAHLTMLCRDAPVMQVIFICFRLSVDSCLFSYFFVCIMIICTTTIITTMLAVYLSAYIPGLYPHWKEVAKTRHLGFIETLLSPPLLCPFHRRKYRGGTASQTLRSVHYDHLLRSGNKMVIFFQPPPQGYITT